MIKKRLCVWLGAVLAAAVTVVILLLSRGLPRIILLCANAAAWLVLLLRFLSIRYHINDEEIKIEIGIIFHSKISIKRAAILSQSRLYLGKHLICTVMRAPAKTAVLFCEIPEKY